MLRVSQKPIRGKDHSKFYFLEKGNQLKKWRVEIQLSKREQVKAVELFFVSNIFLLNKKKEKNTKIKENCELDVHNNLMWILISDNLFQYNITMVNGRK